MEQARFGFLCGGSTGADATFVQAAREWLRYVEQDRGCKPSTLRGYRNSVQNQLIPAFGEMAVRDITSVHIERWRASLTTGPRTRNKLLVELYGIFRRAQRMYGLEHNPAAQVEPLRVARKLEIDVFSPDEVRALVRAAAGKQDAAIFLTAAFTGLRRGELLALRWRDVDFVGSVVRVRASYAANALTTPKSGKVRGVPMAGEVAAALASLGQRRRWTGEDDLVFPGETGGYLDGSALRRRYLDALERAGLRPLRFHDLRHTFGTTLIAKADILRVKEWMGHADVQTTMRYLHYAPRPEDALIVDAAFAPATARLELPPLHERIDASQVPTSLR
ncbi:site-specific integrase [Baekduia soli]|uniref:Site-specific integrase n=1 Tax=Baekduia soli TaxID=496014 RepID=A0A5B8U2Z5_9ACTN|nr:site-specific integrase [Baekduia soli]QEC47301.1 site-specific integrase [Baekduia soli]